MHLYSGRFGWSPQEISNSYKLSARFNILVEEVQGLGMCAVIKSQLASHTRRYKAFLQY